MDIFLKTVIPGDWDRYLEEGVCKNATLILLLLLYGHRIGSFLAVAYYLLNLVKVKM